MAAVEEVGAAIAAEDVAPRGHAAVTWADEKMLNVIHRLRCEDIAARDARIASLKERLAS